MKTRCTFVALLLVALLVCVTAGATVTASAAIATRCTLSASSSSAWVGQTITLSGTLTYGRPPGAPISGASVELEEQTGATWTPVQGTVTTSGTPNFSFPVTLQTAGTHVYRVVFDGYKLYGPSVSRPVSVVAKVELKTPTAVTINGPASAHVGAVFTISGKLADSAGKGLGQKTVTLFRDGGSGFVEVQSAQTPKYALIGNLGKYSFQVSEPYVGPVKYFVRFAGDGSYDTSKSPTIAVAIQKASTTLSIDKQSLFAQVIPWGTPYTVSGSLKDENGHPLSNKDITLYEYNKNSDQTKSIPLKTDPNGAYKSQQIKDLPANYEYFAVFSGDGDYWSAQSTTSSYTIREHHISLTAQLISSGGSFAISGQLRDTDTNKGLAQTAVEFYKWYPAPEKPCNTCNTPPLEHYTVTTDSGGFYKLSLDGRLVSNSFSLWNVNAGFGDPLYDSADAFVYAPPAS